MEATETMPCRIQTPPLNVLPAPPERNHVPAPSFCKNTTFVPEPFVILPVMRLLPVFEPVTTKVVFPEVALEVILPPIVKILEAEDALFVMVSAVEVPLNVSGALMVCEAATVLFMVIAPAFEMIKAGPIVEPMV